MKIAFVLDDSLDNPDGVQQYVIGLGEQFSKLGHEIYYLVGETKRQDIPNVYPLSKNMRINFNGNVVGTPMPANKLQIRQLLDRLNIDVLHVQMPYSPLLAGRVIKAASNGTAIVGTFHIFPNTSFESTMNKLLKLINRRTLKRFDHIVAVSGAAAKTAGLINQSRLSIIPNHVDLKKYREAAVNDKAPGSLIFLGRLVARKGCQLLLSAIAMLKHQGRLPAGVRLTVAGDGPQRKKLENFVNEQKLNSVVTFQGFVTELQKAVLLGSAEIAVFPSTGGESFGIVLLEAMAGGAVILAGKNPGYAEVMDYSKQQLFNPYDPNELADKLEALISSRSRRQEFRLKQSDKVEDFDIRNIAVRVEAVYKAALHSK